MTRRDEKQGVVLRRRIDEHVLPAFANRVLPVDSVVVRRCVRRQVPASCAERDALIATTASIHRLTVATRNVAGFKPTGVDAIDPWNLQK